MVIASEPPSEQKEGRPDGWPVAPVAWLAIVRGDNPVDLFARLQVVFGANGLLGVAFDESAKVDKLSVGDVR